MINLNFFFKYQKHTDCGTVLAFVSGFGNLCPLSAFLIVFSSECFPKVKFDVAELFWPQLKLLEVKSRLAVAKLKGLDFVVFFVCLSGIPVGRSKDAGNAPGSWFSTGFGAWSTTGFDRVGRLSNENGFNFVVWETIIGWKKIQKQI